MDGFSHRFFQKSRLPFFDHQASQLFGSWLAVEFMCNFFVHNQGFVEGFPTLKTGSIAMAASASDFEKFSAFQPRRIDPHLLQFFTTRNWYFLVAMRANHFDQTLRERHAKRRGNQEWLTLQAAKIVSAPWPPNWRAAS